MRRTYGVDIFGTIAEKLASMSGFAAMAKELVQNADDEKSEFIAFDFSDDGLRISNASVFTDKDFDDISNIAARGKETQPHKTGAFGIGFISVYQVTDHPELQSAGQKYVFVPEENAVDISESTISDHTEFFLPWAIDPQSTGRIKLKKPAVSISDIPVFIQDLLSSAPDILLFLRHLKKLRVLKNGLIDIEFVRDDDDNPLRKITEIKNGKQNVVREWLAFDDLFDAPEATQLNKEPQVGVAFPIFPSSDDVNGVLYAFLPTGLLTGYRFHINGDFFPSPDRKGIITEGDKPKADWNTKVITAIGTLLIKCVVNLKQTRKEEELYSFFPAQDFANRNLPILGVIKNIFYSSAKQLEIVPDKAGNWYKPDNIYLLGLKNEEIRQSLEDLGIHIVQPKLRNSWPILQFGLGVKNLDISILIKYIQNKGIKRGTLQVDAPKPLNTTDGLCNLLGFVLDRLSSSGEEKLLDNVSQLAICPDRNGRLDQFAQLKLTTTPVEKFLLKLDLIPFIDGSLQAQCKEILSRISSEWDWKDVIEFFSTKTAGELELMYMANEVDFGMLYDFLADNEQLILKDAGYFDKLKKSSIFLTNKQFKSLSGLCMSGNYKDPIGLDIIINESIVSDKARGFLKKLGVGSLDFLTYITDHAPRYFQDKALWEKDDKRLELADEIRRNYSSIAGNEDALDLLRNLKMIPCNADEYRCPKEIYLKSELLDIVLANKYLHLNEEKVGKNHAEWIAWLKLLGVDDSPRPGDIISRIRVLAAKMSSENVEAIEHLFYYLCNIFNQGDFADQELYAQLKYIQWIPCENDNDKYYVPSGAFLPFERHLFYSQGKIAVFKDRSKIGGKFPDFLKFQSLTPDLIIRHLLWVSQQNPVPDKDIKQINNIYSALNQRNASILDDSVNLLQGIKCLFIENFGFCKASDCYWNSHPFGLYRHQIGDQLRNYFSFLKRIGVDEEPQTEDYVEVLKEISVMFGKSNLPLDENTQLIVKKIYAFLASHMRDNPDGWLSELKAEKIILDRRGLLRVPGYMFFEDKGIMVDIFREQLKTHLIDKESDTWQLLERLGVRHLSNSIKPIDFKPTNDRTKSYDDMDLIANRKSAIRTIIETQRKNFREGWDWATLDSIEIYEAERLSVKYEVKMDDRSLYSDVRSEPSFYARDIKRLYICRDCGGQERTYEIARNLASILNPQIDPCHVLPVLVEILNPSHDLDAINKYLQRMQYDMVSETVIVEPTGKPEDSHEPYEEEPGTGPKEGEESYGGNGHEPESGPTSGREPGEQGSAPAGMKPPRKRQMPGLDDQLASEIDKRRKAWLLERLEQERIDRSLRDSEYPITNHAMTPAEIDEQKQFAKLFYNRQIEELELRLQELESGDGPVEYSIYGPEWNSISRLIRDRDGKQCRRCGEPENSRDTLVVHHICPRKEGGSNWHSNLITLCRTCHAEVEARPWLL